MITPLLPTWVQILGWAVLAMLSAMLLRTFDSLPPNSGFGGVLRKTLGMLLVLLCAVWVIGVASGGRSLLQPLSHLAVFAQAEPSMVLSTRMTTNKPQGFASKQLLGERPNSVTDLSVQNASGGASSLSQPKFLKIKNLAELDALIAKSDKPVMLDFMRTGVCHARRWRPLPLRIPLLQKE